MLVEIQARVNGGFTSSYVLPAIDFNLLSQALTDSHVELAHPSCVRALVADELGKQSRKCNQGADRKCETKSVRQKPVSDDVSGVGFDLDVVCHVSHLVT